MKKVHLFRLMAALLIAVTIPLAARGEYISYTASYNLTQYMATDTLGGVTYSIVNYGDLDNGGEPGRPLLPIDYLRFSVPYNATNFSVTTTLGSSITYLIDHMMYPVQAPRMMNDTTPVIITPPDSAVYYSGQFYPAQKAWVVDEGFLAGENHIVTVAVMPFAFQHTSTQDKLRKYKKVTVKLNYVLSDSLAMYPIVRTDSALRVEGYQLTQSMVVNPDDVSAYAPGPGENIDSLGINHIVIGGNEVNGGIIPPFNPPDIDPEPVDTTGFNIGEAHQGTLTSYPYLIVTTPDLKHAVRRIAALKRQKGYNVKVVTMDEVMNDPYARAGDYVNGHYAYSDPSGVLRQFLRTYFREHGTKFVLLAGSDIPYRHRDAVVTYPSLQGNPPTIITVHDTIDCVSDFYYIELHSDWSDTIIKDHAPDLYVGRILSHSTTQIDNYTDKVYRYELNPGRGDYSYLNNAFFSEGRDFHRYLKHFKSSLGIFYPDSIIINDTENNNSLFPKGKNVIDTIRSSPVGLMCIFNHGDTTRIRVYGYDSNNQIFFVHAKSNASYGDGLNHLNNKYYPFIYYSPACVTVPFDNKTNLNIGESFTTGKDYGGPVYMGYTRKILAGTTQFVTNRFADRIKESHVILGEADALSVWDNKQNLFQTQDPSLIHSYIGDPSIKLWTEQPLVYENITATRNDSTIVISGINDETNIAYYSNDGKIGVRTASSTITLNHISPNSSIMLYKHNKIPYFLPLQLQNVTFNRSQYVIAKDVTAGKHIDTSRPNGDVIIPKGIEYEIEASGKVTLEDGFKVEKGASFAVYPACF